MLLAEMRREKKLTQQELAGLLEISQRAVAAYEAGERRPSPEVVNKMIRIFGITVSEAWEMFYGEGVERKEGGSLT